MEKMEDWMLIRPATAERPLLGMTILVVEDSRVAADGIRQICQRFGARIRRTDSLQAAHRHLKSYRPGAVIVDLGLPDGSGLDLVAELNRARPRISAIIATSGEPEEAGLARKAGADAFIEKPVRSVALFLAAVLPATNRQDAPVSGHAAWEGEIVSDPIAYRDDLSEAKTLISRGARNGVDLRYIAQFLS